MQGSGGFSLLPRRIEAGGFACACLVEVSQVPPAVPRGVGITTFELAFEGRRGEKSSACSGEIGNPVSRDEFRHTCAAMDNIFPCCGARGYNMLYYTVTYYSILYYTILYYNIL